MNLPEESIARECINHYFPECQAAFLAGSSIRNETTEHSDIDVIVIDETQSPPVHQCVEFNNRSVELFVFNRDSISFMFEISRMEGIPTIQHMCSQGYILKDDGSAEEIQQEASEYITEGPIKLSEEKERSYRFNITDLLLDLESPISKEEKLFIAHELFDSISKYVLKANGYWQGHGKWMYRSLQKYDDDFAGQLANAYVQYIKTGESEPFRKCIESVLDTYGGKLLTGYKNTI
ncbi:nucleotidyltransferase domain-containing protein [Oceanobacillus salinisoli]|uniref:nucleotidyltransferase domain-containing protein n=1 Tax=Oceanobacillus salinisoli TaxID=2678611 RepID=UPI0012E10F81|nr:nucleotidyltransferase domain-containing protein [Oceanobacillus salinisoli]